VRTSKVEFGSPHCNTGTTTVIGWSSPCSLVDRLKTATRLDRKVIIPYDPAMNTIGFLLSPGFQLLDFAGPASAF